MLFPLDFGKVGANCVRFITSVFSGGITRYHGTNDSEDGNLETNVNGLIPTYIPDGFEICDDNSDTTDKALEGLYRYLHGDIQLVFHYIKSDKMDYYMDNEYSEHYILELNNEEKADLYKNQAKSQNCVLIWTMGIYVCHITIDNYEKELNKELVKIANGVVPSE